MAIIDQHGRGRGGPFSPPWQHRKKARGFAGWRQHKKSGQVRDVACDQIAQQIEAARSNQLIGILPQGVNKSNYGQISPDPYIRDAFDRLTEVGA